MSSSRRLASQADREAEENQKLFRDMVEQLNSNPLGKRKFIQFTSTANAVQVIWSHPEEIKGIDKKALSYELQYGIGAKVNKIE